MGDRPGIVGPSLAPTTPTAALALSGVFYCVGQYADTISSSPPAIYTVDAKGGRVKQTGTAAARALATLTQRDAEVFAWHAALSGNGFLRIVRDGTGAPFSLVAVPTWRVSMLVGERRRIFYKIAADTTVEEPEVVLPEADVIHARFRTIGPNVYWGVPPASTCSAALGLALASREVQRTLFQNLSHPGGVLSTSGKIDPKIAKEIQTSWHHNFVGGGAGRVAVLSNGLTYQPIAWNAADAQLLETVKASVDDIANCYGIPANFISSATHLTYASASEATRSKYLSALKPFAARCADAISQSLLSRNDRASGAFVDYDLNSILLPPGTEMAQFVATLVNAGVMTANEARNQYLNLPDIEGGDTLRTPTAQPAKATP